MSTALVQTLCAAFLAIPFALRSLGEGWVAHHPEMGGGSMTSAGHHTMLGSADRQVQRPYVQTDGSGYINVTKAFYDPYHQNYQFEIIASFPSAPHWSGVWGSHRSWYTEDCAGRSRDDYGAFVYANNYICYFNPNNTNVPVSVADENIHKFTIARTSGGYSKFSIDDVQYKNQAFSTSLRLWFMPGLFVNQGVSVELAPNGTRIYSARTWLDGVLISDMQPASSADGHGCFYDTVDRVFYTQGNISRLTPIGNIEYTQ